LRLIALIDNPGVVLHIRGPGGAKRAELNFRFAGRAHDAVGERGTARAG
jgi:hypothetical protein